jgi:hypothetical protein
MHHPTNHRAKRRALVTAAILFVAAGAGCSHSNSERAANAEEQASQQASSTPSWMPAISTTLALSPGEVKSVPPGVSGPFQVRVTVNAKQKVSFGLVPKTELSNYTSPRQVENAMERLPCATGGIGSLSRGCELSATDKDFLLVVADLRDSGQATRDMFDDKKKSEIMASYVNSVEVAIYVAIPAGGASQKPNP